MEILIVSATPFEIAPTLQYLEKNFESLDSGAFEKGELRVQPLITGVGIPATMWHLANFLAHSKPDLAINAGIAGSFSPEIEIGSVLNVASERFADLGVEEADGRFTDLFELGLVEANSTPYINGALQNPAVSGHDFLPRARGLTVGKVHGSRASIEALLKKYPDADIESMEGAAFFYACLKAGVNFLEIRSISNRVEPRNRANWNLPLSIQNLNNALISMISGLSGA